MAGMPRPEAWGGQLDFFVPPVSPGAPLRKLQKTPVYWRLVSPVSAVQLNAINFLPSCRRAARPAPCNTFPKIGETSETAETNQGIGSLRRGSALVHAETRRDEVGQRPTA